MGILKKHFGEYKKSGFQDAGFFVFAKILSKVYPEFPFFSRMKVF